MAAKKKEYEVQGIPSTIKATSRCAIEIKGHWYTVESTEERYFPDGAEIDLAKEWTALYESVNNITDAQCNDILDSFGK